MTVIKEDNAEETVTITPEECCYIHYDGFDRVKVVQYDGSNMAEAAELLGVKVAKNSTTGMELISAAGEVLAGPGKWVVKNEVKGVVSVQDTEPAWVEVWESCPAHVRFLNGYGFPMRRAYLSNGWNTPWERAN